MHHRAFGRRIEELDVVVVEDSRPMQTILRSILTACGIERFRVFDQAERARLYARRRDAEAAPGPAADAPAPEAAAVEEAGAAASPEFAPIIVPGKRSGRRVRAEIDNSVWGG